MVNRSRSKACCRSNSPGSVCSARARLSNRVPLHRRDFIKLAALAPLGVSAAAAADDLRVVRVLEVPTDGAKSVLYAQRNNLFRKRGIQADIVPLGSGAAIFAAVLGGSADFGS